MAAGLVALAAALAGCGGDDSGKPDAGKTVAGTESSTSTPTATQPETTPGKPPPTEPRTTDQSPPRGSGKGEDTPGGGGDEEPARTEVRLAVSDGSVKPRRVNVAAFISVRVSFVHKGGGSHRIVIDGKELTLSKGTARLDLDGLRPGKSYRGVVDGKTRFQIVGSNEPGP